MIAQLHPARNSVSPSVCFVAPKAAGLLVPGANQNGGGAEAQQVLVARPLARRGHRVCMVVEDDRTPARLTVDDVAVIRYARAPNGSRWRGLFSRTRAALWRALHEADCDVYVQRGAGSETGWVGMWCRMHGRKFVFSAASDSNLDPALPDLPARGERWLYRIGLHCAGRLVCQSETQQRGFEQRFNRKALVIPSGALDPLGGRLTRGLRDTACDALWVGRIHEKKRPHWVLDLARACPELLFAVAADVEPNSRPKREFVDAASDVHNVYLLGRLHPQALDAAYQQARVVLCTSEVEGFPNVFLEAWARRIPVVTTVDPDGVVKSERLGAVAATQPALAQALRDLLSNDAELRACGGRARGHFLARHTIGAAVDAYERLIED